MTVNGDKRALCVVHFCDTSRPGSCGLEGVCMKRKTGNRCKCPRGYMGVHVTFTGPCQDVYLSCQRWKEEGRCSWARPILPFFEDNCALTCGRCRRLVLALPPILEPLSWMIGRWETETTSQEHFPVPLSAPYREVLDISISEVPIVTAIAKNGDANREVGFMTGKPFLEDTGFAEFNRPKNGSDKVGIEMVSNTEQNIYKDEINVIRMYAKKPYGFHCNCQDFKRIPMVWG
uniref:ShKT domain-containing protein n=1 Tax=Parascaris equorum TaxID=6256 RepID=A0A914RYC8_PAREQ